MTQRAAAIAIGCQPSQLSALESCRPNRPPEYDQDNGQWSHLAGRVADFYGLSPEYLWPDDVSAIRKNAMCLELSAAELRSLPTPEETLSAKQLWGYARELTERLPPIQEHVIETSVVEEMPLVALASKYGLSHTRIGQLRDKGLRQVRHELRKVMG